MSQKLKIISMINFRYYVVQLHGKKYLLDFNNPKKISSYGNYIQKDWNLYSIDSFEDRAVEPIPLISKIKQIDRAVSTPFVILIFSQAKKFFTSISFDNFFQQLFWVLLVNFLIFAGFYLFVNHKYRPLGTKNLKKEKTIIIDNHASRLKMLICSLFLWIVVLLVAVFGIISNNLIILIIFSIIEPSILYLYPIINIYPLFNKHDVFVDGDEMAYGHKKVKVSKSLIIGLLIIAVWAMFIVLNMPGIKYWGSLFLLGGGFIVTFLKKRFKDTGMDFLEGSASVVQIIAFSIYFISLIGMFISLVDMFMS